MESKGLHAYTKDEQADRMVEYNIKYKGKKHGHPQKGLRKWCSPHAIRNSLKNGFKKINDFSKTIHEEQVEDF